MPSCLEINGLRKGAIEIGASLVCGLDFDEALYLVSSEGYYLYSEEDYKLYTETE